MKKIFKSSLSLIIIWVFYSNNAFANNQCIKLNNIKIDSTNKYIDREVDKISQEYLKKCVTIEDIKMVLSHVLASNLKNYNSQISGVMKP